MMSYGEQAQKAPDNRRLFERIDQQARAFFYFNYDLSTRIDIESAAATDAEQKKEKYPAESRNISAEGLCIRSLHKLLPGQHLKLEMYLTQAKDPICLEGEVRWSQAAFVSSPQGFFDTGIKLLSINGRSVPETIHYDDAYRVVWSDVLEVIFGDIKKIASQRKGEPG